MGRSSKRLRRGKERRAGSAPLSTLPLSDERWEGGYLRWGPDTGFAIWIESDDGPIVAGDAFGGGRSPEEATTRLLLEAMRQPAAGPPRVPAEVAVRETRLAEELRAALRGLDVAVLLQDELPSWEAAAAGLRKHLESESAPGYLERGIPGAVVEAFYEAAAAFYRAAPWTVASDDVALELRLPDRRAPVYGLLLGGEGVTYGLALYRSRADLERTWAATTFPPPPVDALAVTFEAEGHAPPALAAERRAHRWALAGPAAFPVPFSTTPENTGAIPDADELALATTCLRAVLAFVAREDTAVRAGREVRGPVSVAVPDAGGGPGTVTVDVAYPVRRGGGWRRGAPADAVQLGLPGVGEEGERERGSVLLEEVAGRVLALPASRALMRRLAWSFHGAPFPGVYVDAAGPGAIEHANMRFYLWAMCFARSTPDGRTLAERALEAATDLDPAALAERQQLIRGRFILGRVVRTEGGDVVHVRVEPGGETLRVHGGSSGEARAGELLLGAAFPRPGGDYFLAYSTVLKDDRELAELVAAAPPEDAALVVEHAVEGAGPEWIQELDRGEVRVAYEDFREDTGGTLPTVKRLERMIRTADSPSSPLRELASAVEWQRDKELEVLATLLMRIWNTTPRPELGGHSPEEKARSGAPGR
jgi:hypothetical protein